MAASGASSQPDECVQSSASGSASVQPKRQLTAVKFTYKWVITQHSTHSTILINFAHQINGTSLTSLSSRNLVNFVNLVDSSSDFIGPPEHSGELMVYASSLCVCLLTIYWSLVFWLSPLTIPIDNPQAPVHVNVHKHYSSQKFQAAMVVRSVCQALFTWHGESGMERFDREKNKRSYGAENGPSCTL